MSSQEHDPKNATPVARLWGGGFREPLDPALERFCESFSFDRRLLRADIAANRAWIVSLRDAGLLTPEETERLDTALHAIAETPLPAAPGPEEVHTYEDVHTYVEATLALKVGNDLAGKLRTGRSRNDLVATDLRLFCREEVEALREEVALCVGAFADLAGRCGRLAVPGYTHMRRAQPILLAHLLLAHAERLMRDDDRLAEALGRIDVCPLGSGALAGTTVPIDRGALARRLGFARPSANSLDAVSDRDFVADTIYACSLLMIHLSQTSEDLILASAEELGWLALSDAAATGSSLMPQKKNPDALELVRGKSGRVAGRLAGFLTALKGLPAAYNRDLQEDKEALFDALDTTRASTRALATILPRLAPVAARGLGEEAGDLLATDLADDLVARGVPFAQAHRLAGEAAARAREEGLALSRLPLVVLQSISPLLPEVIPGRLGVSGSLARRDREGGTAPDRVAEQIRGARAWADARRTGGARGTPAQGIPAAGTPDRGTPGRDGRTGRDGHTEREGAATHQGLSLRTASEEDLSFLEERIGFHASRGTLLPLSGRTLRAALPDFRVLSMNGNGGPILGFGALRRYSPRLAEIRSLVVADGHQGRGFGRRLVAHLLDEARRDGLKRVFVLTRAPDFFERLGFLRVPRESLPEKVFVDCNLCPRKEACDEHALVREIG